MEQLLLHSDSQTPARDQEITWMQILLEEEEPVRIPVPLFHTLPQSQGSTQSSLVHAGAVLLQNTVVKETSKHSDEENFRTADMIREE